MNPPYPSVTIEAIRWKLTAIRNEFADLRRAHPDFKDRFDFAEGLMSAGIIALSHSVDSCRDIEVARLDSERGKSRMFRSRGIGTEYGLTCFVTGKPAEGPNIAAFVKSREEGEEIVQWFGGRVRLDYRENEPNWIQVKVGVVKEHLPALKALDEKAGVHGVIRKLDIDEIVALAKSPTP